MRRKTLINPNAFPPVLERRRNLFQQSNDGKLRGPCTDKAYSKLVFIVKSEINYYIKIIHYPGCMQKVKKTKYYCLKEQPAKHTYINITYIPCITMAKASSKHLFTKRVQLYREDRLMGNFLASVP